MSCYNGGNGKIEELGIAYHDGFDLGFETEDGKWASNERGERPYLCPANITH